jgi:hypothetical protein
LQSVQGIVTLLFMSVTGVSSAGRELLLGEVEKLVTSDLLRGSESLCRILRYLAEHAITHPGVPVKEYQIATEVFGRPADFDARLDSTVRVQTGRLRAKLGEYYAGTGQADAVIVEIPRGSYTLTFHERPAVPVPQPAIPAHELLAPTAVASRAKILAWIFGVIAVALAIALVYAFSTRTKVSTASGEPAPPQLAEFWGGFTDQSERPWVVFSNAEFVGGPRTGMRYFNPKTDSEEEILDHYTGVGEVLAIHELDRLFTSLHHGIRVKRGRLLSFDDAKNNDLIFVGSSSENLTLRDLPMTRDFVFQNVADGARKGDLAIVNIRPRPGEANEYLATSARPIVDDYALVGLVPGLSPGRWVMILAGTTTIGTQAAVEFVCRANNVSDLMARVPKAKGVDVRQFEAVIRVKVSRGVPVQSEMVALHPRGTS